MKDFEKMMEDAMEAAQGEDRTFFFLSRIENDGIAGFTGDPAAFSESLYGCIKSTMNSQSLDCLSYSLSVFYVALFKALVRLERDGVDIGAAIQRMGNYGE